MFATRDDNKMNVLVIFARSSMECRELRISINQLVKFEV